jgi:hypothetical protein
MAKKTSTESEETSLKKKIAAKRTAHGDPKGNAALRTLRKRLKREQRKRRALAARKKHAAGSAGAPAAT